MVDCFPSQQVQSDLDVKDFEIFYDSYSEILRKHLFASGQVFFVSTIEEISTVSSSTVDYTDLLTSYNSLQKGEVVVKTRDYIMFSFPDRIDRTVVAIIFQIDPLFLKNVGDDWLLQLRDSILQEFVLLKQARIDTLTGLLNLNNLNTLLSSLPESGSDRVAHLILIELSPKRTSYHHSQRYVTECVILLNNFLKKESILHYLGQGVFAFIFYSAPELKHDKLLTSLVVYLKQHNCYRVHVGASSSQDMQNGTLKENHNNVSLLDLAWTALKHASKKGPFSFSKYHLIANPSQHIFAPVDSPVTTWFNKLSKKSEQFSLIQFQSDLLECEIDSLLPHIKLHSVLHAGESLYVFLDSAKRDKAISWVNSLFAELDKYESDMSFSAGIGSHPYQDVKKSQILINCKKALLHAGFLGQGSVVVFNDVSLNISGDVYYNEGNLTMAVKEYRTGLECNPNNINLYNSLGVAYAMMNKINQARTTFQQALALDDNDFMTLYNLGLIEQETNQKLAYQYYKKAYGKNHKEPVDKAIVNEIALQLGVLSCGMGKYEECIGYFQELGNIKQLFDYKGQILYYLGKSYYSLGHKRKAMLELQKALSFNRYDDCAMHLLGRVYFELDEGKEVALSLCLKSVELEPKNLEYLLSLSEVQIACKMYDQARENLRRCLRNKKHRLVAQVLMGRCYNCQGKEKLAKTWFAKVRDIDELKENYRKEVLVHR